MRGRGERATGGGVMEQPTLTPGELEAAVVAVAEREQRTFDTLTKTMVSNIDTEVAVVNLRQDLDLLKRAVIALLDENERLDHELRNLAASVSSVSALRTIAL